MEEYNLAQNSALVEDGADTVLSERLRMIKDIDMIGKLGTGVKSADGAFNTGNEDNKKDNASSDGEHLESDRLDCVAEDEQRVVWSIEDNLGMEILNKSCVWEELR